MNTKTVELNYIEFDSFELANENKNYPKSGLFITKTPEGSDFRFIDKSVKNGFCIVPESVFNSTVNISDKVEIEELTSNSENKFDGDFILEFSRILLNRK